MGQAALQYSRRGWPVFPCRECDGEPYASRKTGTLTTPRAKSPYVGKGLKDATRDEARITAWWRQHPNALIGIPMGENGCFALDFDPRVEEDIDPATGVVTDRREWTLDQLKADLETMIGCALPPTLTSRTPSGGVHVWFRQPDGDAVRNRGNLPPHVDVRGQGGYVIGPPSVIVAPVETSTLGEYRWIERRGDWRDDAAICEAPAALIDILRAERGGAPGGDRLALGAGAPSTRSASSSTGPAPSSTDPVDRARSNWARAAFDNEIRQAEQLQPGTRNAGISSAALRLGAIVGAGYLSESMVKGALYAVAARWPDVGKTQNSIDSALAKGIASPRDMADIGVQAHSASSGARSPAARAAGGGGNSSFHSGRAEPVADGEVSAAQLARFKAVSSAWLARRCAHVTADPDALTRLAFSIGRRASAGLIDVNIAKEMLWAAYDGTGAVAHADIDRAIDDGGARGFDVRPMLLMERCQAFPMTDFGIGERFNARYGDAYRFTTAKGWLGWDERRWKVLDQEKDVPPAEVIAAVFNTVRLIQDEARFIADTGVKLELVREGKEYRLALDDENEHALDRWIAKGKSFELLSTRLAVFGRQAETAGKPAAIANLARRWLTVQIEDFDRDPLAINVMNGTLRFAVGKGDDGQRRARFTLESHAREDLNTRLAPVVFDRDAKAATYDAFFLWAHPDEATRRYLHQAVGYTATGDTSEQKLWFHYGKGANGKSTWTDLIAHVLGDYAGTIGIETFLDQGIKKRGEQASPDLARLGGVRFLRASEPERGSKLNEALIKAATGGEPMAVRALHRGFFDLLPLFKLHIGGNYKPDIPGTDEGIWRRMKLVLWNAHVTDAERDETLPLRLRAEASGVLNRVLAGLLDWLTNGLIEPDSVMKATADYRDDSDPLARFLRYCTRVDPDGRIQSSKLHEVFVAWCRAAGEREWKQKGFSQAMKDKGFITKPSNGMQWLGLVLTRQVSDFVDHEGRVIDLDARFDMDDPARDAPMRPPPAPPDDAPFDPAGWDDAPL